MLLLLLYIFQSRFERKNEKETLGGETGVASWHMAWLGAFFDVLN